MRVVSCVAILTILSLAYGKKPVGLPGSHNVCYQNAAIQCLYAIPELTSFLLDQGGCKLYKKDTVSEAYCRLIKQMSTTKEEKLSEMEFCEVAWSKLRFPKGQQSEAAAFAAELIYVLVGTDIDQARCKDEQSCRHVKELFLIKVRITTKCPDCQEEVSRESSSYAYALVTEVIKKNLEESLRAIQSPKALERGSCKCDNVPHTIIRQTQFIQLPIIFVISLQPAGKKPSMQSFPLKLELTYHESFRSSVRVNYELIGCMTYWGTYTTFGHYQACVRDQDSLRWYLCNNTMITELSDDEMNNFAKTCDLRGSYPLAFFYRQIKRERITPIQDDLQAFANDLMALTGVLSK